MNGLKARTFWLWLIEREFNSLKRGGAVHVVIAEEVVGLGGVDDEQSKLQCNKRDGLNSWKTLKSLLDLRRQLLYSNEDLTLLNDS